MIKILLCLLFLISTIKANLIEYNLKSFIIDTFTELNKNFVIDEDLETNLTVYINSNETKLKALVTILNKQNYTLINKDNFFYIVKKQETETTLELNKVRYIKLNYTKYDDIKELLSLYTNITYKILYETNNLAVMSDLNTFNLLKSQINLINRINKQHKIKLSVYEINLGKLKDIQTQINYTFKSNDLTVFDIILGSASINTSTSLNLLTSAFKFLNDNQVTQTLTSTILNLRQNEKVSINSSQNVPFLITENVLNDGNIETVNKYEYKDIGFKIDILPLINNDFIDLDLSLNNSQLLSSTDDKPITTTKTITQKILLTKSKNYHLITGLNHRSKALNKNSIPVISEIPLLGNLFKSEKYTNTDTITTVLIEFFDDIESTKQDYLNIYNFENKTISKDLEKFLRESN